LLDEVIVLGEDTKSDSGLAKERDSDQSLGVPILEESDAVDTLRKPWPFHFLPIFSM
jgi:hypothetical protein